ncbi:MAG: hypothetical protein WA418_38085 [Bradyrhizobium sp.]
MGFGSESGSGATNPTSSKAQLAGVFLLAAASAAMLWLLPIRYPTPIISDEIKYLISAKYLFSKASVGEFANAMQGYSLTLHLAALPFGGPGAMSLSEFYAFARALNVVLAAALVPISYVVLRSVGQGYARAMLGATAVASFPLFYIYAPFAMTEVVFSFLCIAYVCCVIAYLDGPRRQLATLSAVLVVTFLLFSTKVVGGYCVLAALIACCVLYRGSRKTVVLVLLSVPVLTLPYLAGLVIGYGVQSLAERTSMATWATIATLAIAASLFLSGSYLAPLLRAGVPAHDRSGVADRGAWNMFILSTVCFLLPAVVVSSAFHALIGRLTNYRTVAAVMPLFLLASIAAFGSDGGTEGTKRKSRGLRLVAAAVVYIGLLALYGFRGLFKIDNAPDFLTWLPLFRYLAGPPDFWLLVIVGLFAASVALALVDAFVPRIVGLIALNLIMTTCSLGLVWPADDRRVSAYLANIEMFDKIKERKPKAILLAEVMPDYQWAQFGAPYVWDSPDVVRIARLFPTQEFVEARGVAVTRQPVLNADAFHTTLSRDGVSKRFDAYDLDRMRTRNSGSLPVGELIARGNAVDMKAPEHVGSTPFAFARRNAMFGPFLFPAGETIRVSLRAPPAARNDQFRDCMFVASERRWPIHVVQSPTEAADDWVLAAEVTSATPMLGMLRLACSVSAIDGDTTVTLPISHISAESLSPPARPSDPAR